MSDDDELALVIPLRANTGEPLVWSDGTVQTGCTDGTHVFDSLPGACRCGERLWDGTTYVVDGAPRVGRTRESDPALMLAWVLLSMIAAVGIALAILLGFGLL